MRRLVAGCLVGGIWIALMAIPARPQQDSATPLLSVDPRSAPRIVNGVLTADYPTTGALLSPGNPQSAQLLCSGTLIGCETFLTAGHCVEDDLQPASYVVFLQHAGFFDVSSVALHPDYDFPVGDVAVLKLSTAVTGIRPTRLNTTTAPVAGTSGIIVGFGRTGGFSGNYGLKRSGSVTTATCKNGISGTTSVCWDFTEPIGPAGTDSNTCNGDSGGPLFINFGSGLTVAGVTSGGFSGNCLATDNSFDANVYFYRAWIQMQGGADLNNTSCGDGIQVGDAETAVLTASGQLSAGTPSALHTFQVLSGTSPLRVSMNAIDNGSDFDLYVKAGSPPTTSSFDCAQNGSGQFGFCEFSTPASGTWYALVNRANGSGQYQVTATALGGGCSDPANTGQSCDDGNACTQNDKCQSGACSGTNVTDGTPCDDGNACTPVDSCQTGACQGSALPRTDCRGVVKSDTGLFRLQDSTPGVPDNSDKLTWNWRRGTATTKSDFGNPLTSTDYDLCVYDETAGVSSLIMSEHISGGALCGDTPCWKDRNKGFRYKDAKLVNGPVNLLVLTEGGDGQAKITLKAKGETLTMPSLPLHQDGTVTVQLTDGTMCWDGHYDTNIKNDTFEFKARAD